MNCIRKLTAALLSLCLLSAAPTVTVLANTRVNHGVDVSEWQGDIDFDAVRRSGVDIVYIRAGEGSNYTDAYLNQHYDGARAAGLKIGFYHYVTASNTEEARQQAEFFYSLIRDKAIDCRPAMDFESFPGLDRAEINAIGMAFMETLYGLLGYAPALYSDTYNTANVWDSSFTAYPLWVAEYGPGSPSNTGYWDTWDGFQYSDIGSVPGIRGAVDLDYFKDSILAPDSAPPSPAPSVFPYTVRPGDTLWAISRRFGTTVAELVNLNRIADPNLIYPGQVLEVPGNANTRPDAPAPGLFPYTVRPGDTLWAISRRFGTTVAELVNLNHITDPNLIYPGQVLEVPGNANMRPGTPDSLIYRVMPGDTLSALALRFDTTVSAIAAINHIANPNLIFVGQDLVIPQ